MYSVLQLGVCFSFCPPPFSFTRLRKSLGFDLDHQKDGQYPSPTHGIMYLAPLFISL